MKNERYALACRCGYHPSEFRVSPSLSTMSTHDLLKLLEKFGHTHCDIKDEGTGRIIIATSTAVARDQQEQIQACLPAGIVALFTVKARDAMPIPKSLNKWAAAVRKEIKK